MARFRDIPIRRKLMLVIMLTSTTALLVAAAAVATFSWKTVRRALVNDLEAVADIVGANSTAAIAFHDRKTADETLASLKTRAEIVSAQIYDRDGKLLGRFDRGATGVTAGQAGGNIIPNVDTNRCLQIVRPTGEARWIRDRAYPVHDETGRIYRIVGIAEDITERKQLEKEILDISDRERHRIGQDVHDGLCQHLAGTAFAVTSLEHTLAAVHSPQVPDVRRIAQLIDRAITEARHIAQGLSPVELDPQGLMAALNQLAANVSRLFNVDCTFSCQGAMHVRDNAVAMELYHIAREGVNNAIKHGKPKHIWVALTSVKGRVNLTVEDDGVGIPEVREHGEGMGLHIMAYRARTIGGLLDIQRQAARGTIVTCSVEGVRPHGIGADRP
jgi:signal transduction histidine kinase